MIDDGPFTCKVAPEMGSHNLLRVVPVAQHQQVDDVSLLLYSLELYATGFVAVTRLSWAGDSPGLPAAIWTAHDEHGTTYEWMDRAGSGGGRPPDRWSWRLNWMFGAPVSPQANQLHLTVPEVKIYAGGGPGERPSLARVVTGPWEFVIPISTT